MSADSHDLQEVLESPEDEHLEFKQAETQFDSRELLRYVVALANERGGKLVLGVTPKEPRQIIGTQAFRDLQKLKLTILSRLGLRVEIQEIHRPEGRVLVFTIPSRPTGKPLEYDGKYLMRAGGSLVPMTTETIERILDERCQDFTSEICAGASLGDLAPTAVNLFRDMLRKSGRIKLAERSDEQLLADTELVVNGGVTYAALVLLGTRKAVGRHLPHAEVIFEYRSDDASIRCQQRKAYSEGFLAYHDGLWEAINARNDVHAYQDGLFVRNIPTLNEAVVREAILNAIAHRDYRLTSGSIVIRQYPKRLEVVSPGGFPPGITAENILWKTAWRNRRLAAALEKCNLVERSGQGADMMFAECIKEGKPTPNFSGTDDYQVSLILDAQVQDVRFLKFLEHVGRDKLASFTVEDLLVIDSLHRDRPVHERLKHRISHLRAQGVVETVGRGRGAKHILSRHLYGFLGQKGVYTRKKGLDRPTNKALLLRHIQNYRREGSRYKDLSQVLPDLARNQIKWLLSELQEEGRIYHTGRTKGSRWYPVQKPNELAD